MIWNPILSIGFAGFTGVDSLDLSRGLFLCRASSIDVIILFKDVNYVPFNVTNESKVVYYVLCVYGSPWWSEPRCGGP